MSTHEDFPAELVEARAKELYEAAFYGCVCDKFADSVLRHRYFASARLSLRREVEACEPLAKAINEALDYLDAAASDLKNTRLTDSDRVSASGIVTAHFNSVNAALAAHRARYAPAPESLADVARESAEALRGNAALSARLLAAVEREKGGAK